MNPSGHSLRCCRNPCCTSYPCSEKSPIYRLPGQMCSFSFQLLNQFLATNDVTILILYVVNERLQLDVRSRPPITAADFEDGDEEGFGLLSMGEAGVVGGEVLATNSQPVKLGLLKVNAPHTCLREMIPPYLLTSCWCQMLT